MRRASVAVAAVALLGGCSFVFVQGPPRNHEQLVYFQCTTSRAAPVADTIWSTLQALNLFIAASRTDAEWDDQFNGSPPFSRGTGIGLYTAFAALGVAGMYYGFTNTSACREAQRGAFHRIGPGQPETWPPPPGQPPPGQPPPPTWPPAPDPSPPDPSPPAPPPEPPAPDADRAPAPAETPEEEPPAAAPQS